MRKNDNFFYGGIKIKNCRQVSNHRRMLQYSIITIIYYDTSEWFSACSYIVEFGVTIKMNISATTCIFRQSKS